MLTRVTPSIIIGFVISLVFTSPNIEKVRDEYHWNLQVFSISVVQVRGSYVSSFL